MEKNKFLKQLEEGKEGFKKQIEALEKSIEEHKTQRELMIKTFDLQQEVNGLAAAHPKVLEPTHEFQKLDRYWELETQLRELSMEMEAVAHSSKLRSIDSTIKAKEDELIRMKGDE